MVYCDQPLILKLNDFGLSNTRYKEEKQQQILGSLSTLKLCYADKPRLGFL